MARHLVQNSRYTYIANTDAACAAILKSGLFGMREITNDEFNRQLEATGEVPQFYKSDNFDAVVWQH